jgi:hypothetical protein
MADASAGSNRNDWFERDQAAPACATIPFWLDGLISLRVGADAIAAERGLPARWS